MKKLTKKKVKEIVNRYCYQQGNTWHFDLYKFFNDLSSKGKKEDIIKVIKYALENYEGIISIAKTPLFITATKFTEEPNEMLFLNVIRHNAIVVANKSPYIKNLLKGNKNWNDFIRRITEIELEASKQVKSSTSETHTY